MLFIHSSTLLVEERRLLEKDDKEDEEHMSFGKRQYLSVVVTFLLASGNF